MSNPNQGHKPHVPAQKATVPTPVAPAAVAQTKAPEEASDVTAAEVLLTSVVPEIPVEAPRPPMSMADVAKMLGAEVADLEEFDRFRQLSRDAKEAEFDALVERRRAALLGDSSAIKRGEVPEAPLVSIPRQAPKGAKAPAEGEITVFPLKTENRLRIGQRYYQFQARKPISVPADIIPHLVEKGIISPPAHLT